MPKDAHYAAADLQRLRAEIASLSPDTALEVLIAVAYDVQVGAPISAIVEGENDQLGHAIAGVILRYQAFIARGALVAANTSDSRVDSYLSIGQRAIDHLDRAVLLAPEDGLSVGALASFAVEQEAEDKPGSEALLIQAPNATASAYCDVLQAWAWKWGGSQEDMWACLNRLWREDDPCSWAMLARATFEEWLYPQIRPEKAHYAASFGQRSAPAALLDVSERALAAPEDPANPGLMRFVHGWLARVYWDRRDLRRAKAHLARTKDHMDPTIWIYGSLLMNAGQRFKWAKLRCGVR